MGGRYELGPVVGAGGMAQVRRATDTVLGREVAVKVFREDLDESSAARARSEMKTLAGLTHPNLVAVHDAGTADDTPFLVMELVDGPTLAACCLDGSLPADRLAEVGAGVAEALAYVHSRGVIHRDVKPANILLSPSGPKLADFGIARIVDDVRHTGTGLTVGTAPYLAPEQVSGDAVGPPADVYALGLVLLECLKGYREFVGGPVETALARLHRQPLVPDDLPAPWPGLLRSMTARRPQDRPTALDVAAALRGSPPGATEPYPTEVMATPTLVLPDPGTRVLTGAPTRAPSGPPTRIARVAPVPGRRPRRRRLALVAAVVGVLAVVGLIAAAARSGDAPGPTPSAQPSLSRLEQHVRALEEAVRASGDEALNVPAGSLVGAARLGNGSGAQTALATLRRTVSTELGRDELTSAEADRVLAAAAALAADVPAPRASVSPMPRVTAAPAVPAGSGPGKKKRGKH